MTGRIPAAFIDQLLSRTDIVELIDSRVDLRKSGREYSACCPFHSEKTPSFTVSPHKQFYHCFGCGAHGNAIGFLMAYEHLEFLEAVEELARQAGLDVPRAQGADPERYAPLLDWLAQAEQYFRRQLTLPAHTAARAYIAQRGLDAATCDAFGIGYAPSGWDGLYKTLTAAGAPAKELLSAGLIIAKEQGGYYDRFRDRIVFPIRDRRGRCIAFGGRALDNDNTPKYLNSPETPCFHKGRELYGLFEARSRERQLQTLLVVEGYMDVVALSQHGIGYAVATLGTATTPEHLERLFRTVKDLVFCFDGDRAGRQAAWRALDNALPFVKDGRKIGFLFLPDGEDPDSLVRQEGQAAFVQRIAQATPLSDYFFEQLRSETDLNSLDGRARFMERARPLLQKLPDSVFRDMMLARLDATAKVVTTRLSTPPAPRRTTRTEQYLDRRPIHLALALLLNEPPLAAHAGDLSALRNGDGVIGTLVELIEFLQAHPYINTAARILAHYEGTPIGQLLERLTQARLLLSETAPPANDNPVLQREFCGVMEKLRQEHNLEKQLYDRIAQGDRQAWERLLELRKNTQKP